MLSIPVTSSCINNGQLQSQQQFVTVATTALPMGYNNNFQQQQMAQFENQMAVQQQQFLAYQNYQQKFLNYPKYEYYDEQNFVAGNAVPFQAANGLSNIGVGFIPPQDPFVPPSYSEMKNAVVLQPL